MFAKDSAKAGSDSSLSAPLVASKHHAGAVNFYSGRENQFAELDDKRLDLYTTAAAPRAYNRYQHAHQTTEHLCNALTSRAVIDQANGILVALRRISADEAFTALIEQSQRGNAKPRDLAVRFITYATWVPSTP